MASNATQDDDWDLISKAVKCKDERLDKEELTLQYLKMNLFDLRGKSSKIQH